MATPFLRVLSTPSLSDIQHGVLSQITWKHTAYPFLSQTSVPSHRGPKTLRKKMAGGRSHESKANRSLGLVTPYAMQQNRVCSPPWSQPGALSSQHSRSTVEKRAHALPVTEALYLGLMGFPQVFWQGRGTPRPSRQPYTHLWVVFLYIPWNMPPSCASQNTLVREGPDGLE